MAKKYKLTQDGPEVQALLNKIDGIRANQTPGQGLQPIQMENLFLDGVLYAFLTSSVSNLLYYYTKSETYTKSEVDAMVAAIKQFTIQSVVALPQPPSAETMNILYLVPAEEPKVANEKDEFITVIKDGSYAWEQIGSTAIDLSGYVTTEALNTALADYVTSDALATALAGLNDVKFTQQTLTDAQKQQARANIGATAPEIFWATYGVTTASQIDQAVADGKLVVCYRNNLFYVLSESSASYHYLSYQAGTGGGYLRLSRQTNEWSVSSVTLQSTSQKSNDIPTDRESTTKYPSVKAVFDSLGKWGVVSQTQTWSGNASVLSTYTMSDIVRGLIPQAAIDMYENAGAVFNESTGYFEMNGLTDLSYNEIKAAYDFSYRNNGIFEDIEGIPIRTNFPLTDGVKPDTGVATFRRGISLSMYYVWNCENLEVFRATRDTSKVLQLSSNSNYLFYNKDRLREVQGIIGVYNLTGNLGYFFRNYVIEKVHLYELRANWDMRRSPYFALESIVYAVDHSANGTNAITITLHATAFARCQADTTEYTYNGQTYTGILAYAAAKNITLASNG